IPGRRRLCTYSARPVTLSHDSRRGTERPTCGVSVACVARFMDRPCEINPQQLLLGPCRAGQHALDMQPLGRVRRSQPCGLRGGAERAEQRRQVRVRVAMREVTAERGDVAYAHVRQGAQRTRDDRPAFEERRTLECAQRDHGADLQLALRAQLELIEAEVPQIDEARGPQHARLHHQHQRRAARHRPHAIGAEQRQCFAQRPRLCQFKRAQARSSSPILSMLILPRPQEEPMFRTFALCIVLLLPFGAQAQSEPLRIGFLTVRSGPLAAGGKQMEQGIQLFLKEHNNTIAGRKVELIFADTGGNPAGAKTKTQELVERDKVQVVIGPLAAFEALAIDDYIRQTRIPTVSCSAAAEDLTQRKPNPWFARTVGTSGQPNHALGEYAAKVLGYKRVAIIADDFAYGHETAAAFQRVFEDNGGKVVQRLLSPLNVPDYGSYPAQLQTRVHALYAVFARANSQCI